MRNWTLSLIILDLRKPHLSFEFDWHGLLFWKNGAKFNMSRNANHLKQVGIRIFASVANYTGMLNDIH